MTSSYHTQYQISYNEVDLKNHTLNYKKYKPTFDPNRDSVSFEKKSFLNNNLIVDRPVSFSSYNLNNAQKTPVSSVQPPTQYHSNASLPDITTTTATAATHLPSINNNSFNTNSGTNNANLNLVPKSTSPSTFSSSTRNTRYQLPPAHLFQNQDQTPVYNHHFNYIGSEPHVSERIRSYTGAFGPNIEELTTAFKSSSQISFDKSVNQHYPSVDETKNDENLNNQNQQQQQQQQTYRAAPEVQLPMATPRKPTTSDIDTDALRNTVSSNYLATTVEDRSRLKAYDLRPAWIPKKYPGRNMFYSHLDSSIFPGKYDVTEKVWNTLETSTEKAKSSSNPKLDQLLQQQNQQQTQHYDPRVPSFTRNSGFIISSLDKSILPTVKTDHVKAAEVTKSNKYINQDLYHLAL